MEPSSQIPQLITTHDLARRLGLARETIEKRRAHRPLTLPPHFVLLGRTVRYSLPEVEAWIAAGMPERSIGDDPDWIDRSAPPDPHAPLWCTARLTQRLALTRNCFEKRRSVGAKSSLPQARGTGRVVRYETTDVLVWLAAQRVTG